MVVQSNVCKTDCDFGYGTRMHAEAMMSMKAHVYATSDHEDSQGSYLQAL